MYKVKPSITDIQYINIGVILMASGGVLGFVSHGVRRQLGKLKFFVMMPCSGDY